MNIISQVSVREGRNTQRIVMYKNKIIIPQLLQKWVVKWNHTYIRHTGLDRKEAMIIKHAY